jgi:chromosome partitioning protein
MKKTCIFANQKGGVGKTACSLNIGFELAKRGYDILLVDTDPQGNLTSWAGYDPDSFETTMFDVMKGKAGIEETIKSVREHLWLAPSNILLASIEREIFSTLGYERLLKKNLQSVLNRFDHIIIDSPPSLGSLTINGLVASDEVYITVACEHLSVIGTGKLLETIDAVRENYNPGLEIGKVIPTMYTNTVLANEMLKQLNSFFGNKLAKTPIRRNVKIGESSAMGKGIIYYDPSSIGAKDFENLVEEII